jgi:acetyltransferase-like isoleucine patch superfamily enzyme
MLSLLQKIFNKIRGKRLRAKLYRELDIGEGTRVTLNNLDGMFPHLIHIGKNCVFAPQSMVLTHDASCFIFTGEYQVEPVSIGDNCFIGYGVIIMPGVRIGNNVVIGAGSVVTKDILSDSVAAGVPAKVISSISEYLQNRNKEIMFTAPYVNKLACQVSQEDVVNFRKLVYSKLGYKWPKAF